MTEPKPCPFCGVEPDTSDCVMYEQDPTYIYQIVCERCDVRMWSKFIPGTDEVEPPASLIARWNTRAETKA